MTDEQPAHESTTVNVHNDTIPGSIRAVDDALLETGRWIYKHQRTIMTGVTIVTLVKNKKLKKQNKQMIKELEKAAEVLNHSATVINRLTSYIENLNMFERYWGPRAS